MPHYCWDDPVCIKLLSEIEGIFLYVVRSSSGVNRNIKFPHVTHCQNTYPNSHNLRQQQKGTNVATLQLQARYTTSVDMLIFEPLTVMWVGWLQCSAIRAQLNFPSIFGCPLRLFSHGKLRASLVNLIRLTFDCVQCLTSEESFWVPHSACLTSKDNQALLVHVRGSVFPVLRQPIIPTN